jgi:hypothetical protein
MQKRLWPNLDSNRLSIAGSPITATMHVCMYVCTYVHSDLRGLLSISKAQQGLSQSLQLTEEQGCQMLFIPKTPILVYFGGL